MRAFVIIIAFALTALAARATHIVGGEITYTSIGNDDYQVLLKLYRDCGPGNINNTGFDATAAIGVFDQNSTFVSSSDFTLGTITSVPVTLNNPCLTPPSTICIEEAHYAGVIHLPAGTGGYALSYQRCCRSPVVINLFDPATQGITCTIQVPDVSVVGANSSPHFDTYPPIALCVGQAMQFDHSATDADGDQLQYDIYEPYQGGTTINPQPNPPAAPPYSSVQWAAGYSVTHEIDAAPPIAIDAVTGHLTLTPSLIGSYAVGVRVREFRNGVQLSEVIRDFRFDVVPCISTIVSSIQNQSVFCNGLTVNMQNQSQNSNFYHWDFGVAGIATDTSALFAPSYTYPQQGVYTVTLIANPGWPCADTSTNTFNVFLPVDVHFDPQPIRCMDEQPFTLTALGSFTPAANVQWTFAGGSAPDPNAHITHPTFAALGTHAVHVNVSENGCTNDFTDSVTVFPRPVPMFSADTAGCAPLDEAFGNSSTAWTPMTWAWTFGDGSTSTDSLPLHTYQAPGQYTVSLTVHTDSGCIATETLVRPQLVQVWPQPTARFVVDPPVTSIMEPTVTVTDESLGTYVWDFTVDGHHFDTTFFTYTFNEAGWYTIYLMATSGLGCFDTTSVHVFIGDHLFFAPNAFSPNGDGINEVWLPQVKGARLYRLDLFDRWGENIFSTSDPKQGWDGHNYPVGLYTYKAWLHEFDAYSKEYNGSVMLVR